MVEYNQFMYALFIGYIVLNILPPKHVLDYVYANEPDSSISGITQSVDILKGAPDMMNPVVRTMALDMLNRGEK